MAKSMRLTVHQNDDALYLRLDDTPIIESEEVSDGIILDYNAEGKVIGMYEGLSHQYFL